MLEHVRTYSTWFVSKLLRQKGRSQSRLPSVWNSFKLQSPSQLSSSSSAAFIASISKSCDPKATDMQKKMWKTFTMAWQSKKRGVRRCHWHPNRNRRHQRVEANVCTSKRWRPTSRALLRPKTAGRDGRDGRAIQFLAANKGFCSHLPMFSRTPSMFRKQNGSC